MAGTGPDPTAASRADRVRIPTEQQWAAVGRRLVHVLDLAEELPVHHRPTLTYPPLHEARRRATRP